MSSPIALLEEIQRIDLEIDALGRDAEQFKEKVRDKEKEIEKAEQDLEAVKRDIEEIKTSKADLEEKIRVSSERITKDQERLGNITNDKQYKALTKEIRGAENAKKLHEMELASITEKLEATSGELEESGKLLESAAAELAELKEELVRKEAASEAGVKEKKDSRESLSKDVPANLMKMYETIRSRRAGIGIVQVVDEACQGCFIHVPPQVYIQLRKGTDEIITCPHCHRILFFQEKGPAETSSTAE